MHVRSGIVRMILVVSLAVAILLSTPAICEYGFTAAVAAGEPAYLASDGSSSRDVSVHGFAVDGSGQPVVAQLAAVLRNYRTGQYMVDLTEDGEFNFTVAVPDWADEDDNLSVEITSVDRSSVYGSHTLTMREYSGEAILITLSVLPPADTASYNVTVVGYAVNAVGYRVVAPFTAILTNNNTKQTLVTSFDQGEFSFVISVPAWADENDTLYIRITSRDGAIQYGAYAFKLSQYSGDILDVLIDDPPPNRNRLLVFLLILALAGILAGYALFARWMIGKLVVGRANEIRLKEWKRRGGGT